MPRAMRRAANSVPLDRVFPSSALLRWGKRRTCLGEDTAFPHGADYLVRLNEAALKTVFGRKALMRRGAGDAQGKQRSEPPLLRRQ